MDIQTFIDKVKTTLIAQDAYGYVPEHSVCMYRTPAGNACAIGACLTEEQAREADINGYGVEAITEAWPDALPSGVLDFLIYVQAAHDDFAERDASISELCDRLDQLVESYFGRLSSQNQ